MPTFEINYTREVAGCVEVEAPTFKEAAEIFLENSHAMREDMFDEVDVDDSFKVHADDGTVYQ